MRGTTGQLADPTAVQFSWWPPDGSGPVIFTDADPEVTNPSLGVWECVYPSAADSGVWYVRAEGLAGLVAAAEAEFVVEASVVPVP